MPVVGLLFNLFKLLNFLLVVGCLLAGGSAICGPACWLDPIYIENARIQYPCNGSPVCGSV